MPNLHIPNFNLVQASLRVLLNVHVDGEMCVDVTHLVFESLGHTDNKIVDEGLNGSEGRDILAGAVVEFNSDDARGRSGEADG